MKKNPEQKKMYPLKLSKKEKALMARQESIDYDISKLKSEQILLSNRIYETLKGKDIEAIAEKIRKEIEFTANTRRPVDEYVPPKYIPFWPPLIRIKVSR